MDYMILYKWVTPMDPAPSIINSMIAMASFADDPNGMFSEEGHVTCIMLCHVSAHGHRKPSYF